MAKVVKTVMVSSEVAELLDKQPRDFNFSNWVEKKYLEESTKQTVTNSKKLSDADVFTKLGRDGIKIITKRQYTGTKLEPYRDVVDCWLRFDKHAVYRRFQIESRMYWIPFEEFAEIMTNFADKKIMLSVREIEVAR